MKRIILCQDGFVVKDGTQNDCYYDLNYIIENDEMATLTVEEAEKRIYEHPDKGRIKSLKEIMDDLDSKYNKEE